MRVVGEQTAVWRRLGCLGGRHAYRGAIMRFAVSAKTSGFDIHKTGVILLLVGIGVFVVSLLILALGAGAVARRERTPGKPPQAKSGPSSGTTTARPETE